MYGRSNTLSENSQLRNQFLFNAKSDSNNSKYEVMSDDEESFNFTGNKNQDFNYKESQSELKNQKSNQSNVVDEYELENIKNTESPFKDRSNSSVEVDPFVDGSYSRYERNISQNPFLESSLPYALFDANKPFPPLPQEVDDEFEKLRQNERARLKQLARKPRFHFTKLPYVTIIVTLAQVIVFIVELIRMAQLTGSAFQTKPYFNPMLGPSTYLLIYMGARYVPCMHSIQDITTDTSIIFPCANSTSVDTDVCSLSELCGMSGIAIVDDEFAPHQWYRIIVPIFLHAGFLHIIFNLLLQIAMGATIERHIGSIKYFIIYFTSGITGFLLGANFSPRGIASTGASGSLFGILATNIILFIYCGRKNTNIYGTKHYALFILMMIGEIVISLVLGLLPGLDNFSHLGGFAMGILLAVLLLQDPSFVYVDGIITYHAHDNTLQQFMNNWNIMYNFEDKIPNRFYVWCGVRVVCLVLAIVFLVMLVKNFFISSILPATSSCKWCKYINCIPVDGWCDIGNITVENTSAESSSSPSSSTTASSATASSLPTSIDNTNYKLRRLFEPQNNELDTTNSVRKLYSQDSFVETQNIGIGMYIVIGLLTYFFCKRKKII